MEHGNRYLVPRGDGQASWSARREEEAGFVAETTPEGIDGLLTFARTLCPDLEAADLERTWSIGQARGAVADTRPSIGPAPGFANVYVATGHCSDTGLGLSTGTRGGRRGGADPGAALAGPEPHFRVGRPVLSRL